MCGRYVSPDEAAMERYWHIGAGDAGRWLRPAFNVAPSATVPMVRGAAAQVEAARWGLIPPWWRQERPPRLSFNARSEEARDKPMWRAALRGQRCLMPALGWYEWNPGERLRGPSGRLVSQPYYIHAEDGAMIAFAALWASWQAPDGRELLSCALLTRAAAPGIQAIHPRMPVVLAPAQFAEWLSPGTTPAQIEALLAHARQDFTGYRVGAAVNDTGNDGPQLLAALA